MLKKRLFKYFRSFIDLIFPPRCMLCRRISAEAACQACLGDIHYLEKSGAICEYSGAIKKAMHLIKFKGKEYLAKPLARIACQKANLPSDWYSCSVISVPLSKNKLAKRGFNQVDLLFNDFIRQKGLHKIDSALTRIRDTRPQFSLHRADRRRNLRNAFAVADKSAIIGKNILLLDDIRTSGATLDECRKILYEGGANKVLTLTFCAVML